MLFLLPIVLSLSIPTLATVFGAVGIAVTSIEKSRSFYTGSFGFNQTAFFKTPDFDEAILKLPGEHTGSAVVLVQYKNPKPVANLPVKLVFYVDSVKASVDKMLSLGAKVVAEPGSVKIGNTTLPTGLAKDPDGYLIEVNPLTTLGAFA
jgi:catechol 2,3-dioxygenase-like lactoylglutathione lyase family enzyme